MAKTIVLAICLDLVCFGVGLDQMDYKKPSLNLQAQSMLFDSQHVTVDQYLAITMVSPLFFKLCLRWVWFGVCINPGCCCQGSPNEFSYFPIGQKRPKYSGG